MIQPPTRTGHWTGTDRGSGTAWSFEPADEHWRLHDQREIAYWRSRPATERLAQAAYYRVRVHGEVASPSQWDWCFVPSGQ